MTDAADLTVRLIRCPSVTPAEGGALVLLGDLLAGAGFEVHRVDRGGTPNLFARWGAKGATRTFGFNGHTDVVPPGDLGSWTHPPFGGHVEDGIIWGRGATDMKSGVAAFVAAAILDWMERNGERMDACIVGEPSNPEIMGEMMKIGRRGSVTFAITARGVQGHAAYPHKARNPLHALTAYLNDLITAPLDEGTDHFDPTGLQITSIDCGNPASNVIPESARAVVNIRFNDLHTAASLEADLTARAARVAEATGVALTLQAHVTGDAFLTQPGPFVDLVRSVVTQETNCQPVLSTTGGTSDARFIKNHCPVVEFGLVGAYMHQVDERVPVAQIQQLKTIYQRILEKYFE